MNVSTEGLIVRFRCQICFQKYKEMMAKPLSERYQMEFEWDELTSAMMHITNHGSEHIVETSIVDTSY